MISNNDRDDLIKFMDNKKMNVEDMCDALIEVVKEDKKVQTHHLVIGCLEGCIVHLENASLAYYASTK